MDRLADHQEELRMSFTKTYAEAKAHYKPMARKPMKRGSRMKQSAKRLGPGKKTKQWNNARAVIKRRFEKVGITTCELRGVVEHDCMVDDWLSFGHAVKRRKLKEGDLGHVILICTVVHDLLEVMPPEKMKQIVDETIEKRSVQP